MRKKKILTKLAIEDYKKVHSELENLLDFYVPINSNSNFDLIVFDKVNNKIIGVEVYSADQNVPPLTDYLGFSFETELRIYRGKKLICSLNKKIPCKDTEKINYECSRLIKKIAEILKEFGY